MKTIHKRSGFKSYNDTFWINEKGKYGCRYQCKFCGFVALGLGNLMHYTTCPKHVRPDGGGSMKYRVIGHVTISVSVVVNAKSPEEARRLAMDAPMQSFCNQCASGDDDVWSTSGELDGSVTIPENGVEEA